MLIRNAEIFSAGVADVRIAGRNVVEIGEQLSSSAESIVIDARGNALLPGLHDHHIHLLAYAAWLDSVQCGPPSITDAEALKSALGKAQTGPGNWIRGVGYHESVAGEVDRDWLDQAVPDAPVRIQHRSGRLWVLNSRALDLLDAEADGSPAERDQGGRLTGWLFDGDRWLRARMGSAAPSLRRASRFLASRGVTGVTDASPANSPAELELFAAAIARGDLVQDVLLMGSAALDATSAVPGVRPGSTKIHLREAALPSFDDITTSIAASHQTGRPVAVHCVTLTELIFTLSAFEAAGALPGDRIEHAGVAPLELMQPIAKLGLTVVTQPNFIAERGDDYLRDVEPADQPSLYRLRSFLDNGVALAGGTDAPFGGADPWMAMAAAVSRRSRNGAVIGPVEALNPEQAIALFLGDPLSPGHGSRRIVTGAGADLCLLNRPWATARAILDQVSVAATIKSGKIVWRASVD